MPVEIKGQQLRIRVNNPKKYSEILTDDVGESGKLQRIAGRLKNSNKWETQSWRLNLKDYKDSADVKEDVNYLSISKSKKMEALRIVNRYFANKHKVKNKSKKKKVKR
jgi:hypothetical protein